MHSDNFSQLIKNIDSVGMDFSFKLIEAGKEIDGIYQALSEDNYDLIVKNNHKHSSTYLGLAKDEDWHLLRDISIPVLLINSRIWHQKGRILLALEVDEDTVTHQTFNYEMLDYSNLLSATLGCEMHLVNCYLGENGSIDIPMERGAFNISQRAIHKEKLKSYLSVESVDDSNIHVVQGLPDDVIPQVAEHTHADIVVLGAGEHTGFSHFISGHTSEHVIDKLACDVLALKPH